MPWHIVQSGQRGVWLSFTQSFSTLDSSSHSTAGEILGAGRGCSPPLFPNYSEESNREVDFTENLSCREVSCLFEAVSDQFLTLARRLYAASLRRVSSASGIPNNKRST